MKRRDFLKTSAALASLSAFAASVRAADEAPGSEREFYELRLYHFRMGAKQKLFDDYCRNAAIPALNRAGIKPVGIFNVMVGPDSPTAYMLLPCATFEALAAAREKVWADEVYQKAGAAFLNAATDDPAFVRMESTFLRAFAGMPKLDATTMAGKPRVFEMRTYESPSEKAGRKKVEMFNQGEIAIFRRAGLMPIFFGEALMGVNLPRLTYMIGFPDVAERAKNWAVFGSDPEWKRLSGMPEYAGIVSNITNILLQPAPYSQI
ncbi:MAG TPA: NIPSNAP family protein [Verrucomicrobiae bacterium]|jgi:hypothetical protein|nr:NIPSNAP family protein [Verrucomicrobiae bacterium]